MEDVKTERTPTGTHTTINRTETRPSGGSGLMWFLMGGIIVVVAIVGYIVLGDGDVITTGGTEPTGGNVSINVESNDAPAAESAPVSDTAPDAAPTDAETAPAPQGD